MEQIDIEDIIKPYSITAETLLNDTIYKIFIFYISCF